MWSVVGVFLRKIYVRKFYVEIQIKTRVFTFYIGKCGGLEHFFYVKSTYVNSTLENLVVCSTFSTQNLRT